MPHGGASYVQMDKQNRIDRRPRVVGRALGPAACEACAGSHLHELDAAGCEAAQVTAFCSQGGGGAPPTRDSCYATCLHRTNTSFAGCQFGLPLERSHLVRAFALFDAGSRFVETAV